MLCAQGLWLEIYCTLPWEKKRKNVKRNVWFKVQNSDFMQNAQVVTDYTSLSHVQMTVLTAGCSTGLFQVVGGKASLTEGVRLEGSNINDPDNFLNLCSITETLTSSAVLIYQDNGMTVNCVRYAIVLYSGIHFSIAF